MSQYDYYESSPSEPYRDPYTQAAYGNNGGNTGKTGGSKQPKKEHKFLKTLGKTAAIALVFGVISGFTFQGVSHLTSGLFKNNRPDDKENISVITDTLTDEAENVIPSTAVSTATTVTDVADIAENVMPSIVQVTNMSIVEYRNFFGYGQYEAESAGSGIIIDEDDNYLYIATNNHVVANSRTLTITFVDDTAVEAEIQGTLSSSDLAVVKVKLSDIPSDTLSAIKVATLGSSENIKVGEGAVVIGNALGYGQSVTTGVISATGREVTLQDDNGQVIKNYLIQTDAAVNPGNSGGALLNMNGEVIGIVSAKYSDTDVEGMGYAIPITQASEILTGLVTNNRNSGNHSASGSAYLGIAGVDITRDMAIQYRVPVGVYVSQIMQDGAADEAGLSKGDVIVSFDGAEVSSMEELSKMISQHESGDTVSITYYSSDDNYENAVTITATLKTKPM